MVALRDNIARGSADKGPRRRARPPEFARMRADYTFRSRLRVSMRLSSDGEFPLELSDAGLLQLFPLGGSSAQPLRRRRAFSRAKMRAVGVGAAPGKSLRRSWGHRLPAPARGWRRGATALRGGKRGDRHEVSILIRVGDGERAGRGPSKVSTMIIRPPQQGQRRTGEGPSVSRSSVSRSASAGARSGAASK